MRTRIKGKSWTISRRRRKGAEDHYGWADHTRRQIFLHPDIKGKDLAETVIHEVLHVHFPDLSEEAVTLYAREATRILGRVEEE